MIEVSGNHLLWRGSFLCYRYEFDWLFLKRDNELCSMVEGMGLTPTCGEGKQVFFELQDLTQKAFYFMTMKAISWLPPRGDDEGLAKLVNAALGRSIESDQDARIVVAMAAEAVELKAFQERSELLTCRATPRLVLEILGDEAITADAITVVLAKLHEKYGDTPTTVQGYEWMIEE